MDQVIIQVVGMAASILSTIAFLPQTIYVIKTKDTRSLSLGMYAIFVVSVILWLAYGLLIIDWPIIIANVVCTVLASIILYYKVRNVLDHTDQEEREEIEVK